ncbi:PTS sugar transporter subunit IIA [Spirochaetota bacterium]
MKLSNILNESLVSTDLKAKNKSEVLEELMDILVDAGAIKDRDSAFTSVLEREQKISTGMRYGIAIPHGKTESIEHLVACLGISKNGIDFESMDGELSRIFIMTLSPPDKIGPHLQFLAEISQLFKDEKTRNLAIAAANSEELMDAIAAYPKPGV